jgi:hypothetical protein
LLDSFFSTQIPTNEQEETPTETHKPRLLGWWDGPLEEQRVGTVLDCDTLHLYETRHYGYLPSEARENPSNWNLLETIESYEFVERRSGIFLRF